MTPPKTRAALFLSIAALLLCALTLATPLLLPDATARAGLGEKLWYVSTVLLGLGVALALYALFSKSYALYSGKALGGQLELGGPAVLVLVFVVLGFALPPRPAGKFDLTVFLRPAAGTDLAALQGASLALDLGADRRIEAMDGKGAVRFVGIPAELAGRTVSVALLQAAQHELAAGPGAAVALKQEALYLDVRWKPWQLQGQVLDGTGRPLAGAQALSASQKAQTDAQGRFAMTLDAEPTEAQRVLEVQLADYTPWRNAVAARAQSQTVQLERSR